MSTIYSGHSHSFDVGIARALGVNAAVVFNHIVYWLRINASKNHNIREGKVWMYEKQQEISDFLEYLTLDEVKKAIGKLIDAGLIVKDNFNDNPFDKTGWYTTVDQNIIHIQKTLTKVPNGTIGKAKRHLPESNTAPCIYKDQEEQQEEQQQRHDPPSACAAVFSEKSNEEKKPEIYPILEKVDIPISEKKEITKTYSLEEVMSAVTYATHPETKIRKCLTSTIKWACKVKPVIQKSKEDIQKENKAYAMKYDGKKKGNTTIEVLNNYVEISQPSAHGSFTLLYSAKDFIEKFVSALTRANFPILEVT